jgi:MFS family permease
MLNPYASPTTAPEELLVALAEDPAVLRRQHVLHERGLRQGIGMATGIATIAPALLASLAHERLPLWGLVATAVCLGGAGLIFGLYCFVGAVCNHPWAWRPVMVLALVMLPLFPVGTMATFMILSNLLAGPKPKLLSREYQYVVEQTPHLTPRTHVITWLVLVLFMAFVISVILVASLSQDLHR